MKNLLKVSLLVLLCAAGARAQLPTWPGQPGNLVGFAAAPGWPGSFTGTACSAATSGTSWATATLITNCTYSTSGHTTVSCNFCIFQYVAFISSATADNDVLVTGTNVLFFGDSFQSKYNGGNVSVTNTANNIYFYYSSFTPLISLFATPPAGAPWPGAGTGANSTTITSGSNAVPGASGYEIAIEPNQGTGAIYTDHCDMWGYADAYQTFTVTAPQVFTSNWLHDIRDPSTFSDHTDGIGYLNGAVGPNNMTIIGNTIAMLGNTNVIAFQANTSSAGYQNIHINENYLSGDNATIAFGRPVTPVNSTFYGNVFGTDIKDSGVIDTGAGLGSGSLWACNTIGFRSGTTWTNSDGFTPTSGMNGQFLLSASFPNSSTDQGGNTVCAIASPAAINFGLLGSGGSSAGTVVTLTNTNTSTLNISSVTLATGTHYTIASKTCGATLASGANCTITVKFTPTAQGPLTDTLQITDNSTGVSSPQIVPLAGVGTAAGANVSAPTFSPIAGTYGTTQTVSLSTATSGASICYTTDGTIPTELANVCTGGTTQTYTTGLTVSSNQTIKALGTKSGLTDSSVVSANYVIGIVPVAPSLLMLQVN